jgi:hypothetical protein
MHSETKDPTIRKINSFPMPLTPQHQHSATMETALTIHLAGHAVAAWIFGSPLAEISLKAPQNYGNICSEREKNIAKQLRLFRSSAKAEQTMTNLAVELLAGPQAESILLPDREASDFSIHDLSTARQIGKRLTESEEELGAWLQWISIRAKQLVLKYLPQIKSIMAELETQKTMSEVQILQILTRPVESNT